MTWYLTIGFIAVVMGNVVLLVKVWFNPEFVDTVFELVEEKLKDAINKKS